MYDQLGLTNPPPRTRRVIVTNIGALYTCAGMEGGGKAAARMTPIVGAELEFEDGKIMRAGPATRGDSTAGDGAKGNPYPAPPEISYSDPDTTVINANGALVTPGLVDPHTHVVYGGSRASEMAVKLSGVPYLEILASGGGILSTVRATREASDEELFAAAAARMSTMLRNGTTTVEIKSGYGLSTPQELRTLRIIERLSKELPLTVVSTFMGAHAIPTEFRSNRNAYIHELTATMIPAVAEQGIARYCDVFCESAVFSVPESKHILQTARRHGLGVKIHADEIEAPGDESGAHLAADLRAVSADHLRATTDSGFKALAEAGVVPVVLPATSFCLRDHRYAEARAMIDQHDLPVALATDDNPGTSPTESLQMVMALGALELGMTPEEILAGVTVHAARAIGMAAECGTLEVNKRADAVIWQAYDLNLIPYRFGVNQVAMVIQSGHIMAA